MSLLNNMRIKKEVFEISARIIQYLDNKERRIAYHEDLIDNLEADISTKRGKRTFSDSLNLLEEFGLVQVLGTDAYKLLSK
ncbi:unnamed protein product [marine sediment metagenome]|uniref:Dam-replacing protein HTH domain-containing protein n=1 Tax=marine sediment metagenome TaxID=412755 RepID=X0S7P8_9ZZZZ